MKYLLDTNIIVPLEPGSPIDLEMNTGLALEFFRLAGKAKQDLFIHPAIEKDLGRDKDRSRAELRRTLLQRYSILQRPPSLSHASELIVGATPRDSNDWVDHQLLASVEGNAVDCLITEDAGIHKKAARLGLKSRVLRLADAITSLERLFESTPVMPPAVTQTFAYELDASDPVFESLRADYPGFDLWLDRCKREHRTTYVIRETNSSLLAGLCILKHDDGSEIGLIGKTLKICTFKVSDRRCSQDIGNTLGSGHR